MPLVAHSGLPTFRYLRDQGHEVLSIDRAVHQDIRELHIGFLNMMPDAALRATERQFIRLVGSCNRIAQFFVYPFSLPELERSADTLGYIERYYSDFDTLRDAGLDALIITGANVANPAPQTRRSRRKLSGNRSSRSLSGHGAMLPRFSAPAWRPMRSSSISTASTGSRCRRSVGAFTATA
jgi:hypothetical protein